MILETLLSILGVLCSLGVAVAVLVLPVVALVQIGQLNRRLAELERALERASPEAPVVEMVEAEATSATEATPAQAALPSAKKKRKPKHAAASGPDWSKLEAWLGVRALGWAAVVLLLFTGGFFLKLFFDEGFIGELGRVLIGIGGATLLCVAGWFCQRRGQWIFSQMLTAAGITLLYLAAFASFGYYRLLPQDQAAPFLLLLIAEAFALAALYEAPSIAIMAVVGGLLTPILLHSDRDQYVGLFTYLAILNGGVIVLALFRRWWVVTTLALVGTHGLFWGWYFEHYHPGKLGACVTFELGIFALYLVQTVLVHVWQKKPANVEDLLRLLLVAALTSGAGYQLLDDQYFRWLGTFAVGMAIVFALLAALVNRFHAEDQRLLFLLLALAMAFVAMVFPLQTEAAWIPVGWAVQGLALWWFGMRVRAPLLYGAGAAFLALALVRLVLFDTLSKQPHDDVFIPVFNRYGFPAVVVAGSAILAAVLQRRTRPTPDSIDFWVMRSLGLAGVGALWVVLSVETYDFFIVRGNFFAPGVQARLTPQERELPQAVLQQRFAERAEQLYLTARMSLSALWAVFALVLLGAGLRMQHRPLRWLGLGLFALTLGKVILVDTERLGGIYRVGAFFALSLMMAAGAWAYQELRQAAGPGKGDRP